MQNWNLSEKEAIELQKKLAGKVIKEDKSDLEKVKTIVGVDVAYSKNSNYGFACAVALDSETLKVKEITTAQGTVNFPYISGLFSFRELPLVISAIEKLQEKPELIVCDAQGIAHPRRLGLASHLGVLLDISTIGCSKTHLIGNYKTVGARRGDYSKLIDKNEEIGLVLRTQNNVKPLFISIGNRISLDTTRKCILNLCPKHRQPETTRLANQKVNELRSASE